MAKGLGRIVYGTSYIGKFDSLDHFPHSRLQGLARVSLQLQLLFVS